MKGLPAILAAGLILIVPGMASAQEPGMLGDLECVAIVAEDVSREAEDLGIDVTLLHAAIKVGVVGRLPDLRFDADCPNELYVQATVLAGQTATGSRLDYTASLRLELRRLATLVDNRASGMATVWDVATLLAGRPADARDTVVASLKDLTAAFAAACHDVVP